jgi:hypothetical protein
VIDFNVAFDHPRHATCLPLTSVEPIRPQKFKKRWSPRLTIPRTTSLVAFQSSPIVKEANQIGPHVHYFSPGWPYLMWVPVTVHSTRKKQKPRSRSFRRRAGLLNSSNFTSCLSPGASESRTAILRLRSGENGRILCIQPSYCKHGFMSP